MKTQDFNDRLRMLSAMTGSGEATELFSIAYEELLGQVKAVEDRQKRQEYAARMRRLLDLQLAYMMNAWLRGQRIMAGG